jgi:hypothetical protein
MGAEMQCHISTSIIAGCALLVGAAVVAEAQHRHEYPIVKNSALVERYKDEPVALGLDPVAEAGLKLTMREHLEAIREIVGALGRQEFEKAASIAHQELGFPKHHQAMEREAGATFPPGYHELALAHHQEAEALATEIPSKEVQRILPQLEKTIGACVSCHRAYKL